MQPSMSLSKLLTVYDSEGKAPSGILEANIKWLGSYGECTRAKKVRSSQVAFTGKYCWANVLVS